MNQRQLSRLCTLERIASVENLFRAAQRARRGKRHRPDVEAWWLRRETELTALREALLSGAYLRYTDDFLLFGDEPAPLWQMRDGIVAQLASVRLRLAEPKSRLLATREGLPFCGFRFLPGQRPRILGATKRQFERRRNRLVRARAFVRLGVSVFAWYQFSREANAAGLRRAYSRWRRPIVVREKCRTAAAL